MTIEVKVPMLPESVADATVLNWHKKPGEAVQRDETLVELETDKVVLEVPAPDNGVLGEIMQIDGAIVTANDVLVTIEPGQATTAVAPAEKIVSEQGLSPAVRRLVAEHNIDIAKVQGTGKGGRITKDDIMKVVQQPAPITPTAPATVVPLHGERAEKRVPMSRLRARVAERLVHVQQTAAMLTTFNEINMKPVMDLRAKYKDSFVKTHDVRLGFMSFFAKAAIEALKRFPAVNSSIDGNDIVYHSYFDLGVAVSTERGLVVPVIRDADTLKMADIEKAVQDYAIRARDNKLLLDELQGGTFTITNGGVFGSLLSTPILNPPQVGILGMHKIEKRAVVENDELVVRPMMYVALTYDHRIIDGKESVQFLATIKDLIEDPMRLLLDV